MVVLQRINQQPRLIQILYTVTCNPCRQAMADGKGCTYFYIIVRKSSKTSAAIFLINKTACWLLAKISRTVPTHSLPPHPFRWQREAEKFIVSLCDADYLLHSSDDQPLELLWNSPSKVSSPGVRLWSTVASFPKTEAQRKPSVRKL